MPEILSLALFARTMRTLAVRRKDGAPPFAGRWLLPGTGVAAEQSAEEALESHCFHELGVETQGLEFAETLYLEDEATGRRYVANVFQVKGHQGTLRFRSAGDYDDARWLTRDEIAQVAMPVPLRDWLAGGRKRQPTSAALPVLAAGTAPDNRAAWNTISRAYQESKQVPADRLAYGPRCPDEDELRLLGDVAGRRVLVLGCGGGQDCIALARRGAQVVGIDLSDKQIEYGRRLAEREGVVVTLLQGNVEELADIADETQDIAVSAHALTYVEYADRAFAEAFRVLKPGAVFVFSVHHPFDACLEDSPPFGVAKGYWEPELDWQWEFPEQRVSARMRSWYRPVGEWLSLLTDAGFRIDRVLEPPPTEEPASPWDDGYKIEKQRLIPATLIVRATRP